MILLIPLALWLGTAICYLALYKNAGQSFRRSLLVSSLIVFCFLAGITEILGAFNLLTGLSVIASWAVFDVALLLTYLNAQKKHQVSLHQIHKSWLSGARTFVRQTGVLTTTLLCILLSITLAVAIVATPNNLDSLSYHLSRLGYWIQNRNVSHYATHIERSVSFSPFSEYVHLHTFLLAGSERYFQLLQWFSLVGILAIISLLTTLWNATRASARIALIFAATLPIAVLESMTTQNDLVVAFFIMATAFYCFDFIKTQNQVSLISIAPAVALGMMTKGTFAFYVLPFGLSLLFFMMFRPALYKALVRLACITALLVALFNVPFWYRTNQVFGSPIGQISEGNKAHIKNPADFLSSVSKHVFLHLGFVSPGNQYNHLLEEKLLGFHEVLGTPLRKPGDGMEFKMNKLNFNEDFAHNFLAIWLVLISIPIVFFARLPRSAKIYGVLTLLSFLIFCFFIAYQTYGSRLHIAFFMLYSPVIGLAYGAVLSNFFARMLIIFLWLGALPFALLSSSHPLLSTRWFFEKIFPPINQTFHLNIHVEGLQNLKQGSVLFSSPEQMIWGDDWQETKTLVEEVEALQPQNIGFDLEEHSFDFAYQYSLRKPGRRFEHVAVRNPSRILEKASFVPDLIIAEHFEGNTFNYHNRNYIAKPSGANRWLYIPVQPTR
jgi:hypothetical protein